MADTRSASIESVPEPLTSREQEILVCLGEGLSNQEIASRLYLAEKTVRWYNTQIYSKLGVGNRREAIERARVLGLLDTPSDAPPAAGKHPLPAQATPFVGRRHELDEIAVLLSDPNTRLITILAPGGMGKTRLALEAARMQLGHYADGVVFVPLAPLSSASDITTTIAENIGFSFYGESSPAQQLIDFLRERSLLLVLDNFEHLLDGAPLVADLIQAAPSLRVLTTSRERLNLHGETVYALRGLDFPTWETPEDALEYDAVKLFMESARRVRFDFELQVHDLDYLARICRLTEGMPLGIELAAGWVDVLSLEQIAAEIQRGIDILETDMRDVPERQRSVRAMFDRTWERLSDEEQRLFMRLSMFRGGFMVEAARVVADADVRSLRKLANKALVQTSPDGRHDIHELLRQYAEEQLMASGHVAAVRDAHSAYHLGFLVERDEDIKGRRQQQALQEISTDLENIRAGWLWAVERQRYELIQRSVLDCLVNFGDMSNQLVAVQTILEQTAAAFAPTAGEPPHPVWEQVVVRREWVNFHLLTSVDHVLVETILGRARERGDQEETAWCLWVLTDYAQLGDDHANQCALAEASLAQRRTLGDEFYIAHALMGLYGAYVLDRQFERGLECLHESAAIARRLGETKVFCFSVGLLGLWSLYKGSLSEAETYFDQAITLEEEIGKTPAYVALMTCKAALTFWRGELERAAQLVQAGLDFAQGQDYLGWKSLSSVVLSFAVSLGGDYTHGRELCEQARARPNYINLYLWIDWGLALACCGSGDDQAANQSLQAALRNAVDNVRSPTFQWLCLPLAAILSAHADQPERAVELLGLAYAAPPALTGWLGKWPLLNEVQHQLTAEISEAAFKTAWERGRVLELERVVEKLLRERVDE